MSTVTSSTARSPARRRFNKGCHTLHMDEIELAKDLHTTCIMLYGQERSRRTVRRSPAALFRRMRYGRRVMCDKPPVLCLVHDNSQFMHWNKAEDRHILTPFVKQWPMFVREVRRLALMPRWADGWSATAEVLDGRGYAIAESIAALLCYGIDGDEGVLCYKGADD